MVTNTHLFYVQINTLFSCLVFLFPWNHEKIISKLVWQYKLWIYKCKITTKNDTSQGPNFKKSLVWTLYLVLKFDYGELLCRVLITIKIVMKQEVFILRRKYKKKSWQFCSFRQCVVARCVFPNWKTSTACSLSTEQT
jgi:hypothetical protein